MTDEKNKETAYQLLKGVCSNSQEVDNHIENLHSMLIAMIDFDYDFNTQDSIVWTYQHLRDLLKNSKELFNPKTTE